MNIIKTVKEKRCVLCGKTYSYKYRILGRGCLDNLYEQLNIKKPPRFVTNKEMYLCNRIAWRNHKFFLGKDRKYLLVQKYIALDYLNKMDYESLENTKIQLNSEINNIRKLPKKGESFNLNAIYQIYNYSQKFNNIINEIKNINLKNCDEELANKTIKSLNFIFDITKKTNPIYYAAFYSMQYTFWQIVIGGGLLTNKKLSVILLNHSLSSWGKTPENLIIDDKNIIDSIINDDTFKETIKKIIEEHNEEKNINIDNLQASFRKGDLLFALHNATMQIKAVKNENNIWNIEIQITDTYDFTDFKCLSEYLDEEDDKFTDILATTLNNFAVASSNYGVIKFYNVKIDLKFDSTRL